MRTLIGVAAVVVSSMSVSAAPPPDGPRSQALAAQLAAALTERHLDAIAAEDPAEPGRFVAALFYPGTQMLVVSARSQSPDVLRARLRWEQYREIYQELQGATSSGATWFLHDMRADGLPSGPGGAPDTLYDGARPPEVFDGARDSNRKGGSGENRGERQIAVDQQYSALLSALLGRLHHEN